MVHKSARDPVLLLHPPHSMHSDTWGWQNEHPLSLPEWESSAWCWACWGGFFPWLRISVLDPPPDLLLKLDCSCFTYKLHCDTWWSILEQWQLCCKQMQRNPQAPPLLCHNTYGTFSVFKLYTWWHRDELDTSNLLNLSLSSPWLSASVSCLHFRKLSRVEQYCSDGCNDLGWPWFHPWADSVGVFFPIE